VIGISFDILLEVALGTVEVAFGGIVDRLSLSCRGACIVHFMRPHCGALL